VDTQKVLEVLRNQGGEMPLKELIDTLVQAGVDLRLKAIRDLKEQQALSIIPGSGDSGTVTTVTLIS
jgi:hypothetical protein